MIMLQLTANTGPEECCLGVRKALARLTEEAQKEGEKKEGDAHGEGKKEGGLASRKNYEQIKSVIRFEGGWLFDYWNHSCHFVVKDLFYHKKMQQGVKKQTIFLY
jgi:hypothetical protein